MTKPKNLFDIAKIAISKAFSVKLPLTVITFIVYYEEGSFSRIVGIYETRKINDETLVNITKSFIYTDQHRRLSKDKFNFIDSDINLIRIDDNYGGEGWGHYFKINECHTIDELFCALIRI